MVNKINSPVMIDLELDSEFFVTCKVGDRNTGDLIEKLFNKIVGGFEAQIPQDIGKDQYVVRFKCQLHLADDVDATINDRGNTIADAFIRVVNVASKVMPQAKVDHHAKEFIIQQRDIIEANLFGNPQFIKLLELEKYLPELDTPASIVCKVLVDHKSDFVLDRDDREGLLQGAYIELPKALEEDDKTLGLPVETPVTSAKPQEPQASPRTQKASSSFSFASLLGLFSSAWIVIKNWWYGLWNK